MPPAGWLKHSPPCYATRLESSRHVRASFHPRILRYSVGRSHARDLNFRTRHGSGQPDALAAGIESKGDADAAAGASFLRGLIADEADNTDGLRQALARLSGASAPLRRADQQELQARLALRQDDLAGARVAAMQAAGIRQEAFDYRGMARALAVAALVAERAGDGEAAADLYLRAGRSAAAQSDADTARPWLKRVLALTKDPDTEAAAKAALGQPD